MKSLDIVLNNSNIEGQLFIDNDGLSYNDPEKGKIRISHDKNIDRPLYVSELKNKLEFRSWHILGRKFIGDDNELYESLDDTSILKVPNGFVYEKPSTGIKMSGLEITKREQFEEDYNEIIKKQESMKENNKLVLYNSSKMTIDLLNDSIVVDLMDKDEYTNTISLIGVEQKVVRENLSGKVDLTVQYTKKSEDKIYIKDITFEAFSYDSDSSLVRKDFISSIGNSGVLIEYVGGIVRVIPEAKNIEECVINNCVITYGCI